MMIRIGPDRRVDAVDMDGRAERDRFKLEWRR
jgi:hypothetical protein